MFLFPSLLLIATIYLSLSFFQILQGASFVVRSVFTNNGFKPKMLEFYYREILQVSFLVCLSTWVKKKNKNAR